MLRTIMMMVVGLAAAGCAQQPQYQLTKPGATQGQMQADAAQCRYEAVAHSPPGYVPPAYSVGHAVSQGVSLGIGQAVRQEELMGLCLQARGWSAQPVEQLYQYKGGPTVRCRKADGIVFYTSAYDCPGVVER